MQEMMAPDSMENFQQAPDMQETTAAQEEEAGLMDAMKNSGMGGLIEEAEFLQEEAPPVV